MAAQDPQVNYHSPLSERRLTPGDSRSPEIAPQTPQIPTYPATPSVPVAPEAPPPEAGPPAGEAGGRKFPLRMILIALGSIVLILVLFLLIKAFLGSRAPKAPPQVNLTYWSLWEDPQTINSLISQFEAQNPGFKITYVQQSKQDYRDRLQSSLAKGTGPDIFRFHATWVPMFKSNLAPLPSEIMSAVAFQETFYPTASKDLEYNGQLLGIPLIYDGLALYANEDIFSSNAKTPPKTWDELRRTALELTVRDSSGRIEQAGVAMGRTDNVDHWQDILALMMLQNRANLGNPTGQLAEDALSYFTIFTRQDNVWDGTLPRSTETFAQGKLAMYFGPSWRVAEIKSRNPALNFKIYPMPQLPKNNPQEPDLNWASYWVEGVFSKSQYQGEAWEFLQFMSEKNTLEALYQGIMGTRGVGFVYPRTDMASLLTPDPLLGAYVQEAPTAVSWYLASDTNDGASGINSKLSVYFADAVNGVVDQGKSAKEALTGAAAGIAQVLTSYGVTK
ncbi:MAG: extracellular solute-binding protein [Candidatus Blackburnbacteria bacterium]|nr:extracellular solute-binding protein [Candidatus Blackburnbacteria bacterium]